MTETIDTKQDARPDTRNIILKAASERILHYGYGKTTMSEIAADCGMSAGNIYRFFPSKIDIADAMSRKSSAEFFALYMGIAEDPKLSPVDKLKSLFRTRLDRTFMLFDSYPKLVELGEIIARERPAFLTEQLSQERQVMETIIAEGVASGDLSPVESAAFTAEVVQCATMRFRYPQVWSRLSLPELRHELEGVLALMLHGLSKRH